jgi:hypothetical protein
MHRQWPINGMLFVSRSRRKQRFRRDFAACVASPLRGSILKPLICRPGRRVDRMASTRKHSAEHSRGDRPGVRSSWPCSSAPSSTPSIRVRSCLGVSRSWRGSSCSPALCHSPLPATAATPRFAAHGKAAPHPAIPASLAAVLEAGEPMSALSGRPTRPHRTARRSSHCGYGPKADTRKPLRRLTGIAAISRGE